MDRIISKEKEREDPRRELQSSIQLESKSVSSNSTRNTRTTVFLHAIQQLQTILHTESILPQEILQLQGSSRAYQYKASSSNCSCASKHSTWQNPAIRPYITTSTPGPHGTGLHRTGRLPAILPSRNSVLGGSQHPHSPYKIPQAHSYRILPGEIGFILKRVKYCISMQY